VTDVVVVKIKKNYKVIKISLRSLPNWRHDIINWSK